jgi:hypothetical protein
MSSTSELQGDGSDGKDDVLSSSFEHWCREDYEWAFADHYDAFWAGHDYHARLAESGTGSPPPTAHSSAAEVSPEKRAYERGLQEMLSLSAFTGLFDPGRAEFVRQLVGAKQGALTSVTNRQQT